jgi:hypothetical protein
LAKDVFQDVMSEIFSGIEGVEVIVDDLLIWAENQQQRNERLKLVLERASQKNLKLNKERSPWMKSATLDTSSAKKASNQILRKYEQSPK